MNSISDILVSVIIPIYKVEEYLDNCVQSVCLQSYTNIEIILVDDGSPDSCSELCDAWVKKDHRIKVIHQNNQGLSGARNTGLKSSMGEYVLYVDSDDTIEADMVENLVYLAEKESADVAISTFCFATDKTNEPARLSGEVVSGSSEEMLKIVADNGLWQSWAKLIKREIAIQCMFEEGLIYEDYENTPRVFLKAKKVVISMDGRYNYTVRNNSIMGERHKATSVEFAGITQKILELYEHSDFEEMNKEYMYRFLFKQLVYNYNNTLKYGSGKGKDYIELTRKILREQQKKWCSDNMIRVGIKFSYWIIINLPQVYSIVYKLTHK